MVNREKRPKMVFRKFLQNNQKKNEQIYDSYGNRRKIRARALDVRVRPRKNSHS